MWPYDVKGILAQIHAGSAIDPSRFPNLLHSRSRLKATRTPLPLTSLPAFLMGLLHFGRAKLLLAFVLFVVQLGLSVGAPFVSKWLIEGSGWGVVGVLVGYKLGRAAVGVVRDWSYYSLGFEWAGRVGWQVVGGGGRMSGTLVNLIEYDCNLMANLPYSFLTALFSSVQVLVLLSILAHYLSQTPHFSLLLTLLALYLAASLLLNGFTLAYSRRYLRQKDRRLRSNLSGGISSSERGEQLRHNRNFLLLKVAAKAVGVILPMLITLYVFVFTDRDLIQEHEYILLVIINLLRSPIAELLFAANMLVEVGYSARRIQQYLQRVGHPDGNDDGEVITDGESVKIMHSTVGLEKGEVEVGRIWKYCVGVLGKSWMSLLLLAILAMFVCKYINLAVTRDILGQHYTSLDFWGLGWQAAIPLILYVLLIYLSQRVAHSLFGQLHEQKGVDCEKLNRLSGDVTAIDRSCTTNGIQFMLSLGFIIASYLYSLISLNSPWIQLLLFLFLAFCVFIAYRTNRFIMRARRQVLRRQCALKARMLKGIAKGKKVLGFWRGVFECRQMGLFLQNYYMCVLSIVLLGCAGAVVGLAEGLQLPAVDKSIILVSCLNVDYDMLNMFFSAVRLQLSLVSFERVLNALS